MKLLGIAQEPVELIVGQIRERRHAKQFSFVDHLDLAQILMDELDGNRSFADSGGHALHGPVAHIAYRKNSRHTRLQQKRVPVELPTLWSLSVSYQIGACQNE